MKFFAVQNNGMIAVVSEEHAKIFALAKKAEGDPLKAGFRVFTFSAGLADDRYNTYLSRFVTGTKADLEWLIKQGNHELDWNGCGGWSGNVPFSNGRHEEELKYHTNLTDVRAAFGLS